MRADGIHRELPPADDRLSTLVLIGVRSDTSLPLPVDPEAG